MTDLSKRLKSAATDRETVTPDEHGMRVLSASLDRAKALMAEAADALEWRPIAEVPRDGTVILVYYEHGHMELSWWHNRWGRWLPTWGAPEPVYWQPLPTPPEGE